MTDLRDIGASAASAVLERVGRGISRVQEGRPLDHDLLESDEAYLVVFDAPGVTSSGVQVRFVDGEVEIRIDRFRDFREGFEMVFPGRGLSLDGSASLPDDATVDAENASATLADDGTLRVRVPKPADETTGDEEGSTEGSASEDENEDEDENDD